MSKTSTAILESAGVRIRMLQGMAGDSWVYAPGDIVYVPEEVAHVWLAHGLAEKAPLDSSKGARRPERFWAA